MGVNNLLNFLRQTNVRANSHLHIDLERSYDLFVDLAIIVVPLMQRARSVAHFKQLLGNTFGGEGNKLVELIVGARSVSMYLDMFSPKMKIETHNTRCVKMLIEREASTRTGDKQGQKSRGKSVRLNVVKLRDIRPLLSTMIVAFLSRVDSSIGERCTIDTDLVGEGEIKCFRSAINRSDPCDVAILSNDNDIFLMLMIHHHKLVPADRLKTHVFYRVQINDSADTLTDINIQKISIDKESILNRVPASSRWCVLLWLICCSGTDFVSPLRPFSTSRRVEIFQHCLFDGCSALESQDRSFSFNNFLRELRRFVSVVEAKCSSSVERLGKLEGCSRIEAFSRNRHRSIFFVATWIVRLYWNLLYIIDLPVDFFRQPTFDSDENLAINGYVPNIYTSFFLTSSVFRSMGQRDLRAAVATMLKFV